MKVGLIVECGPQGLEHVVCPKIIELLATECNVQIDHVIRTMSGKDSLILDCAAAARALFSDGCDRVVIIWDENPPWTETESYAKTRCWHFERLGILERFQAADIPLKKVGLVCVEHEFETIFLYDMGLIRAVVSASHAHPAKIKKIKDPLRIDDPTGWLEKSFRQNKSRYNKAVVAKKFAAKLNSLDQVKRCEIFRLLAQQILGKMPKGWDPYIYTPRGPAGSTSGTKPSGPS